MLHQSIHNLLSLFNSTSVSNIEIFFCNFKLPFSVILCDFQAFVWTFCTFWLTSVGLNHLITLPLFEILLIYFPAKHFIFSLILLFCICFCFLQLCKINLLSQFCHFNCLISHCLFRFLFFSFSFWWSSFNVWDEICGIQSTSIHLLSVFVIQQSFWRI